MPDQILNGRAVSPGIAVGTVRRLDVLAPGSGGYVLPERRRAELRRAMAALDTAEVELDALAARLRDEGRIEESEMIEVGALMVEDPALRQGVQHLVMEGSTAADAILAAAESSAEMLADLDDEDLAGRAIDVRSVGRRAARHALEASRRSSSAPAAPAAQRATSDVVLIAADLGPADVAELGPDVCGVALAEGGVTAHAAIVARSRGLPMVVQCGSPLLALPDGETIVVDGTAGTVEVAPHASRAAAMARSTPRAVSAAELALPSITRDGQQIRVLANVAGVAEVEMARAAGAEGVGLLRTELAFLDATSWPMEEDHRRMLKPILDRLAGRVATVRLLDFGGDKVPPFLRDAGVDTNTVRGIRLMPDEALDAQIRAVLSAGHETQLRLLIPMVRSTEDIRRVLEPMLKALSRGASRPEPCCPGR